MIAALQPLRHRTYRALWLANIVSNLGGLIHVTGAGWLMASGGRGAELVALVQAAMTLPPVLLSLIAGALADVGDRRRLMLTAQFGMAITSALLAALAWAGWATPAALLLATFAIGCGSALNQPAWMAAVSEIVPREDLPSALMLNSVGYNLTRALGPAIGGFVLSVAGPAANFLLNAVSYLGEIGVIARWRPRPRARVAGKVGEASLEGLKHALRDPDFGHAMLLRALGFGASAAAVLALLPVVVRAAPGGGAQTYGLVLAVMGAGAVVAGLSGAALRERIGAGRLFVLACAATGIGELAIGFGGTLPAIAAGALVAGLGWVYGWSTLNSAVLLAAPPELAGRWYGLYQLAAFAGMTAGSALFGVVAGLAGAGVALLCAAVLAAAAAAVGRAFRVSAA